MTLNADMSLSSFATFARVLALFAIIGPVHGLVAVHPGCQVLALRDHCHREPLVVVGDNFAGSDSTINGTSSEIDGLSAVLVLVAVLNLCLVAFLILISETAKENAAVEHLAIAD